MKETDGVSGLIACTVCGGWPAEVEVRSEHCHHQGCCPCATKTVPCDHCGGTGVEPCAGCDTGGAMIRVEGDYLCSECANDWYGT